MSHKSINRIFNRIFDCMFNRATSSRRHSCYPRSVYYILFAVLLLQGCQSLDGLFGSSNKVQAPTSEPNPTEPLEAVATIDYTDVIKYQSRFSAEEQQKITDDYRDAQNRLIGILGEPNASTLKINICHPGECSQSFLNIHSRQNVNYSDNLANEILSAWLVLEIDKRQKGLRKTNIPAWFTYGFAAAASDDKRFSETIYLNNALFPPEIDLFSLETDSQWRWAKKRNDKFKIDMVSLLAAQEVRSWYKNAKGHPLSRIIKEVNFGADFNLVYRHLSDVYSAVDIQND